MTGLGQPEPVGLGVADDCSVPDNRHSGEHLLWALSAFSVVCPDITKPE